ncbi:MAG: TolC family protein [Gemmatimonadota bacterium]
MMTRHDTVRAALAFALLTGAATATATAQEAGAPAAVDIEDIRTMDLDQALELARENAPALIQSQSALEIARHGELSAWGSFLPQASLSYGYSNSSSGRLDPAGQQFATTNYSAQLRGSIDIFQGGRRFNQLKEARLGVDASRAQHRQSWYATAEAVKVAYYNAVANRELVRVEADRVQRQEDQLSFVRQQLELGRATRSDVLRSQVDLNNARVALLNAENAERASTYTLAESVGLGEPLAPAEEAELEADVMVPSRSAVLSRAMAGAPPLVSARAETRASTAAVASAKSAYLPTLSLSGGWAWSNTDFPPEDRSWSLSLSGSLPLFNGFSRETQVYSAEARRDQAEAEERATELSLRSDLDSAFGTIEAAVASIDLAEQTVELSAEDLRVTRERYRLGLATILDLQSAQITLRQAEVDLIQRRFDYRIGIARLEAILGGELSGE